MLEVKGLGARVAATGETILRGVNLTVREGETHAIMGTNGSGKSTFSKVLVGHPDYEVTGGTGAELLGLLWPRCISRNVNVHLVLHCNRLGNILQISYHDLLNVT